MNPQHLNFFALYWRVESQLLDYENVRDSLGGKEIFPTPYQVVFVVEFHCMWTSTDVAVTKPIGNKDVAVRHNAVARELPQLRGRVISIAAPLLDNAARWVEL
jgi:hypothetical protein